MNYFFEFDIDKIKCGFEERLLDAQKKYPDGVWSKDIKTDEFSNVDNCWYNPVGYYNKLTDIFNHTKNEILNLINNPDFNKELIQNINKFIDLDVKLFFIFKEMNKKDKMRSLDSFDETKVEKIINYRIKHFYQDYFTFYKDISTLHKFRIYKVLDTLLLE